MLYNVVLFLHVLGVVVMVAAVSITLTAMVAMLHAKKTESLREWSSLSVKMDALLPFSVLLVLLPGLYLTYSSWGWGQAWINFSLITLLLMSVMGPIINLPRLKSILSAVEAETDGVPSPNLTAQVRNRVLWNSVMIMTLLVVGILFLMTVKVGMIGSLLTLLTAIAVGAVVANVLLGRLQPSISRDQSA